MYVTIVPMEESFSNNSSQMFKNDHPQRRLHILLSILAFVLVVGSITYYQLQKTDISEQEIAIPQTQDLNKLIQAQKPTEITEMKTRLAENPPLSQAEKDKALLDLKT